MVWPCDHSHERVGESQPHPPPLSLSVNSPITVDTSPHLSQLFRQRDQIITRAHTKRHTHRGLQVSDLFEVIVSDIDEVLTDSLQCLSWVQRSGMSGGLRVFVVQ